MTQTEEVWCELRVNEEVWRLNNNTQNNQAGRIAWYEKDDKQNHYFYFVNGARHYVLSGKIARINLVPSFILRVTERADFTRERVKNIARLRTGVDIIDSTNRSGSCTCIKPEENGVPGIGCVVNIRRMADPGGVALDDPFVIIVEDEI